MNILSVCTNLPTDKTPLLGTFVANRLSAMAELSHVRALTPRTHFPLLKPYRPEMAVDNLGFKLDVRPMFYIPRYLKHLDAMWMSRCVERWIAEQDPSFVRDSVIDAHFGYPEGVGCYRVARKMGLPIYITIRGLEVDLFSHPRIGPMLTEALNGADGVIAVSDSLCRAAVEQGVSAENITVIPNGIDHGAFQPGDKTEARTSLQIDQEIELVVCVGNLKPVKGHDVLLSSFARLAKSRNALLVCIGGGTESQWGKELKALTFDLGINDKVLFAGAQAKQSIINWLRAADVFTLASHREGCCNAVLEALAVGVPCAVTDAGDNSRLVDQTIAGAVSPVKTPEGLADAMMHCLTGTFSAEQISDSARKYTWSNAATSVTELISANCGDR